VPGAVLFLLACSYCDVDRCADNVEGSLKICHPDSKLHIYDRSKGAALTFDFAPHRYPTTQPILPVVFSMQPL
jgi:hypothetical protein